MRSVLVRIREMAWNQKLFFWVPAACMPACRPLHLTLPDSTLSMPPAPESLLPASRPPPQILTGTRVVGTRQHAVGPYSCTAQAAVPRIIR